MKSEFALAFNEILEDKGLPRDVVMAAINSAMVSAYRKSVGASNAQGIRVDFDLDKGTMAVFAEKEVTDEIFDDRTEVLLEDARKIDPNCQIGDLIMVESTPENFGRLAAQNARQAIQKKIRDAERAAHFQNMLMLCRQSGYAAGPFRFQPAVIESFIWGNRYLNVPRWRLGDGLTGINL